MTPASFNYYDPDTFDKFPENDIFLRYGLVKGELVGSWVHKSAGGFLGKRDLLEVPLKKVWVLGVGFPYKLGKVVICFAEDSHLVVPLSVLKGVLDKG